MISVLFVQDNNLLTDDAEPDIMVKRSVILRCFPMILDEDPLCLYKDVEVSLSKFLQLTVSLQQFIVMEICYSIIGCHHA